MAFTLADGIAYVEAAINAGMDVDDFAGRLSFFFNAHNNLLEEVAKYRAARPPVGQDHEGAFPRQEGALSDAALPHPDRGSTLTAQQPDNNIVRVAIQTLLPSWAAPSLCTPTAVTRRWALPTEDSVRIALRTQQIVAYESGVADTIDPLAGSYYVEHLTDEIERIASEYIAKIDDMGGAVKAIEQGYIQREIADSSYNYQKAMEAGDQIVVGVNKFQIEEPPAKGLLRVDASVADNQIAKLHKMKEGRDNVIVKQRLEALRAAAATDVNLMHYILDCARVYATEGEICNELRAVFGEYRPLEVL